MRIVGPHPKRRHGAGRRAVVPLELAVIAPVMLIIVAVASDAAGALIAWEETWKASAWIAFSAQSLAVRRDQTTSLTPAQATLAMSAIYGAIPQIQSGAFTGHYAVTLSAVDFVPTEGGRHRAVLAWSVALAEGSPRLQDKRRSCGAGGLTEVEAWPQTAENLHDIASLNVSRPASMAVADVYYEYDPPVIGLLTGPIEFYVSTELPNLTIRNDQELTYESADPHDPNMCRPA